jgi:hypothetical protein
MGKRAQWPVRRSREQWHQFVDAIDLPIKPALRRSVTMRRQMRQLARAWQRKEVEHGAYLALSHYFGPRELIRFSNRLSQAESRWTQGAWLFLKRREMEDRLETIGISTGCPLPRDCWKQGFDNHVLFHEPPPDELHYAINLNVKPGGFAFWEWLRDAPGNAQSETYWAAYAAWVAHWARARRGTEWRFRLGRLLERCELNLQFPERAAEVVNQTLRKQRQAGGQAPKGLENIWIATCLLVAHQPLVKLGAAWESFPDAAEHGPERRGELLVYRDGDKLVQLDDRTGREDAIEHDSFKRYLTKARELLRSN